MDAQGEDRLFWRLQCATWGLLALAIVGFGLSFPWWLLKLAEVAR
jgi:hypothetical protein